MARFTMRWWPFQPYSDWQVRRRGRCDGSSTPPIPAWESDEPAPFIGNDLQSASEHDAQVLARGWNARNSRLKVRWARAEIFCQLAVQRAEKAQREHENACVEYQALHGQYPPTGGWGRTLGYMLLMFLLFIFELPLNAVVFRVFGENEVLTFVFTCGVAIVLLLSAHELGKLLKDSAGRQPIHRAFITGLILLPLLIVGGVAYAREEYLSFLPDLLRSMNPWVLYVAFAAINLTIYAVATILSYQHYLNGLDEVLCTGARMRRALKSHAVARLRLHAARARRIAAHHIFQSMFQQLQFEARRLKGLYQTENLVNRQDRAREHATSLPRSFSRDIALNLPRELADGALDWALDETSYLGKSAVAARGTA